VGVDGISADAGLTTHDEVEAHTNRMMISRAARVMVVADGSKVGRVLLARIAPVEAVTDLVTDSTADPEALDALRRTGLAVHVV
jgi:DeoR family transcriptional regulator of aga operon